MTLTEVAAVLGSGGVLGAGLTALGVVARAWAKNRRAGADVAVAKTKAKTAALEHDEKVAPIFASRVKTLEDRLEKTRSEFEQKLEQSEQDCAEELRKSEQECAKRIAAEVAAARSDTSVVAQEVLEILRRGDDEATGVHRLEGVVARSTPPGGHTHPELLPPRMEDDDAT